MLYCSSNILRGLSLTNPLLISALIPHVLCPKPRVLRLAPCWLHLTRCFAFVKRQNNSYWSKNLPNRLFLLQSILPWFHFRCFIQWVFAIPFFSRQSFPRYKINAKQLLGHFHHSVNSSICVYRVHYTKYFSIDLIAKKKLQKSSSLFDIVRDGWIYGQFPVCTWSHTWGPYPHAAGLDDWQLTKVTTSKTACNTIEPTTG